MFVLFAIAAFTISVYHMWGELADPLHAATGQTSEINKSITATTGFLNMTDYMFLGAAMAMFIVMIILALMIPTSPIFFIIYVIYLIVAVLVAPILSNSYELLQNSTALLNTTSSFPIQNLFMSNLPLVTLLFGVILLIATYMKIRAVGE